MLSCLSEQRQRTKGGMGVQYLSHATPRSPFVHRGRAVQTQMQPAALLLRLCMGAAHLLCTTCKRGRGACHLFHAVAHPCTCLGTMQGWEALPLLVYSTYVWEGDRGEGVVPRQPTFLCPVGA